MAKSIKDSYNLYKKEVKNPVNIKTYLKINAEFNKFMINKVLNGEKIALPERLGTLCIMGKKHNVKFDENGNVINLAPDWKETTKLWKKDKIAKEKKQLIYHTNDHTDNVRYKYLWSKTRVLVENKILYSLRLTRTNKRTLHKKIIEGKEYISR